MPEVGGTIPCVIAEAQGVSETAAQPTTTDGRERRDWWVAALRREGAALATAAQAAVLDWCYGLYNHQRRYSAAGMKAPITYENDTATNREAA